jgi:hypothetical protein
MERVWEKLKDIADKIIEHKGANNFNEAKGAGARNRVTERRRQEAEEEA